ncbi:MAG: YerC/YecD family TrpR-related protein [Acutalibacteraceae bacterium]|nr:YerC/YecD family TrpR-related protein [Acutalibacteraceae bacterium]
MSDKKAIQIMIDEMYELLVSLKTTDDCRDLFSDMCTNKEIEQMAQRIKAARLLIDGKTYNQVIEETEISSATLSRVSRCVQYGNGYSKFLKNSVGENK